MVRTSLTISRTVLRWVDGAKQELTDALTMLKGNADLLRAAVMEGRFAIVEEKRVFQLKEEQRVLRKERAAGIESQRNEKRRIGEMRNGRLETWEMENCRLANGDLEK